ncbi:MAG: carbohydrate kinase family protein [Chloroflexota bacterium]
MPAFDLLVAGEINPDLILSGDVEPAFGQVEKLVEAAALTIGSSSAIFACGAARLGLRVAFVGLCGDDVFGRFMLEAMQQRGVDTRSVIVRSGEQTGLSVILNRGADRAILTYPGLIPALQSEDVPDSLLRQARHLHVASYFLQTSLQPGLPGLFSRARALGLTTSLDTNWDPSGSWRGLEDLWPHTNVFLPNAAECLAIVNPSILVVGADGVRPDSLRPDAVELAARKLAARVDVLAVKLGAQGALGLQGAANLTRVASIPVQVVDTVGAGDSFDAGFIFGYLSGWELEKCLRLGVVCGALSTQAAGGVAGQPALAQALEFLP